MLPEILQPVTHTSHPNLLNDLIQDEHMISLDVRLKYHGLHTLSGCGRKYRRPFQGKEKVVTLIQEVAGSLLE